MSGESIRNHIETYYRGERISNAVLVLIGLAAITSTALLFLWRHGHLSTGFFYSAVPLGLFYIVTGSYRFVRSLRRYRLSVDQSTSDTFLKNEEIPHLEGRIERFLRKRNVDTIGFLLGFLICIAIVLWKVNHVFLGTSVSITIFSALLLVFDLFGQFRTEEYRQQLRKKYPE